VEYTVSTIAVVLLTPGFQSISSIVHRSEPASVEALVAQASLEALDVAVLHRLVTLHMEQADLPVPPQAASGKRFTGHRIEM
jgi:hypothetical protein